MGKGVLAEEVVEDARAGVEIGVHFGDYLKSIWRFFSARKVRMMRAAQDGKKVKESRAGATPWSGSREADGGLNSL